MKTKSLDGIFLKSVFSMVIKVLNMENIFVKPNFRKYVAPRFKTDTTQEG